MFIYEYILIGSHRDAFDGDGDGDGISNVTTTVMAATVTPHQIDMNFNGLENKIN